MMKCVEQCPMFDRKREIYTVDTFTNECVTDTEHSYKAYLFDRNLGADLKLLDIDLLTDSKSFVKSYIGYVQESA